MVDKADIFVAGLNLEYADPVALIIAQRLENHNGGDFIWGDKLKLLIA